LEGWFLIFQAVNSIYSWTIDTKIRWKNELYALLNIQIATLIWENLAQSKSFSWNGDK
jgi:hypothetical protein